MPSVIRRTLCHLGAAGLILIMMASWVMPAAAGRTVPDELPVREQLVTWELSNAAVVALPQVMETDRSTIFAGYLIEADATCLDEPASLQHGTFHLNLTIYSPTGDVPWEQGGWWTLRGAWSISREGQVTGERRKRHDPVFLHGRLEAVLPFNPLTQAGFVRARMHVSLHHGGSVRGSGTGTFSGNERFVGAMTMSLPLRAAGSR